MIWLMQSYSQSKSIPTFKLHRVIITFPGGFVKFFFILLWYVSCKHCHELMASGMKKRQRNDFCITFLWYGTCKFGFGMGFAGVRAGLWAREDNRTTSRFILYLANQYYQFRFFSSQHINYIIQTKPFVYN